MTWSRTRTKSVLVALLLAMSACAPDPLDGVDVVDDESLPITICLNGAGGARHPGNQVVEALCDELPGVVRDCSGEACTATFRFSETLRVVDIVRTLRAEHGSARPLHLLGYSWGGVNALDVALRLAADVELDDDEKRVARLAVIDPFAPFIAEPLDVADNVSAFWSYRHSVAPPDDCSRNRPIIGPYEGKRPRCLEGTPCLDFDWSLDPAGRDVDHCTVTDRSAPAVRLNLVEGADATRLVPLPPFVPVERRSADDVR